MSFYLSVHYEIFKCKLMFDYECEILTSGECNLCYKPKPKFFLDDNNDVTHRSYILACNPNLNNYKQKINN